MPFKTAFPLVTLLAFAPLHSLAAIGPTANLNLVNVNVSPDGYERSAVLVQTDDGVSGDPGPLITANKGDTFQLNVINNLSDQTMDVSTSIHWHGILQRGSNWADGAAFVNQCPIAPGHSFTYEFAADTAGTFWYHSHLRTQYCEGLRGVLVVYDSEDPYLSDYDVDDENTVITLADWFHSPGAVGAPQATLINGKGRYSGGPTTDLAVVNVEAGKKYRFRVVSIACDPNYTFSIDGHTFTIIEVDGILHEPLVVDQIQIFAGQRYSVIMEANQSPGNYWIRANPNLGTTGFSGGLNSAILRYAGADETEPATTTAPTATAPLVQSSLTPFDSPGAPGTHTAGAADVNLNLALGFSGGQFTINGATYTSPSVPVLLQIMSGAYTAQDLLPSGSVYTLPRNAVVELSIPGASAPGGPHPMHLHGHTFDVIKGAGSTTYDWDTPVRRDVVSIGATTDNVTIRFTTDNPGPWILHCHIDRHLTLGLAVVFAEAPDEAAVSNPVPDSWEELCPIYDALDADLQ